MNVFRNRKIKTQAIAAEKKDAALSATLVPSLNMLAQWRRPLPPQTHGYVHTSLSEHTAH